MLQQDRIGGMLAEWPGLLFADDLHSRQIGPQVDPALDLPGPGGALRRWPVVHHVATEQPRQLLVQQQPLLLEQLLAERPGEPGARATDQRQPFGVGFGEEGVGHGGTFPAVFAPKMPQ
ncbi:hypothetical protein D9M69_370180 [compost metagenome]